MMLGFPIDVNSGTGNTAIASVSVLENTTISSRWGSVAFIQNPGGNIVRTLTVSQEKVQILQNLYEL
jgi:hypothetical protein